MAYPFVILGRVSLLMIIASSGVVMALTSSRPQWNHIPGSMTPKSAQPVESSDNFPSDTITGKVVWKGTQPVKAEPIFAQMFRKPKPYWESVPNPHAPVIHAESGEIANALVYIRNFTQSSCKPWPYPKARIELNNDRIRIDQGDHPSAIGLIRTGAVVTLASRSTEYDVLRARGSDFFSYPFVSNDHQKEHRFDIPGPVQFTSGAGNHLNDAFAWVCEHPYYTLTDKHGNFELSKVPLGEYELAVWLPNWKMQGFDRDPETGNFIRIHYHPPIVGSGKVIVIAGKSESCTLELKDQP